MGTLFWTQWHEGGFEKGIECGMEQGEKRLVLHVLNRRFGRLHETVEAQIEALMVPQLESLSDSLIEFKRVEEVVGWLDAHQNPVP